jgi:uncharacterized protein
MHSASFGAGTTREKRANASLESTPPSLKQFSDASNMVLETYKKDGTPKQTVVWLVVENGIIYVRTDQKAWKARRIRRNSHVRIIPSNMRGKTSGTWVDGEAHFVEGDEALRILNLFKKKYGLLGAIIRFFNWIRGANRQLAIIAIKPNPS